MNNEPEVKLEEIFEDHFNNDYIRQLAFKQPIFDSVEIIGIQLTSLLSKDNIEKLVNYFYSTIYEKLYTYLATGDIIQFKYELIKTGQRHKIFFNICFWEHFIEPNLRNIISQYVIDPNVELINNEIVKLRRELTNIAHEFNVFDWNQEFDGYTISEAIDDFVSN